MKYPKCGSEAVNIQVVSETKLKTKHHGCIWWLCVGWWWEPIMWLFLTIPKLIYELLKSKKYKAKTIHKSICVCQQCGHRWKV